MTLQPSQIDMHYEKTGFECGIDQFLLFQFLDRPIVTCDVLARMLVYSHYIWSSSAYYSGHGYSSINGNLTSIVQHVVASHR